MAQYVPSSQYPSSEYTIEAAEAALKQLNELGFPLDPRLCIFR